ncbi:flagellar biosynthesis protein FliQ [Sansalvadorimonas sp. 2012CJ34-2]|uniref:Flagellar biosynthetic protein FliQ n=1 Tax=Parendozoicomonas callyspongiae TaxID=2942213 RepID=A0ABT0PI14_9GAMM|nr:flagellar biosynthesis protein FliQ [Sansalvadorimonas sp. 2012CJ34-2]MCL6270133.1 flagellar biosynthesis protein FliQ [Sansalvadorimonas sp. 2012CJ34-2]
MTPETVVDIFREAQSLIVMMVLVLIGPGLVVGLVVAIFQAATQINEQTLSFLPRLVATLITMGLAGHWLIQKLMELTQNLFFQIPSLIG